MSKIKLLGSLEKTGGRTYNFDGPMIVDTLGNLDAPDFIPAGSAVEFEPVDQTLFVTGKVVVRERFLR